MATVDELFETMTVDELDDNLDTMFVIDPVTRMVSVPESEMIFGVESDSQSEKKRFLSPRYVGNNIDLSACFLRVNYRNANGDIDSYLVNDLQIVGNDVVFSWELSRKVTEYKGFVHFVVCAGYANREGNIVNEWNTTVAMGTVLEGIEPTIEGVTETTSEVITQLLATVANQTANVEAVGAAQVTRVEQAAESARIAVEASIEAKGTNTLATIPEDYTGLSERVDELSRLKAGAIVCEKNGSAIEIDDASDLPLRGLRVFGRSTQDDVPTPTVPVEIESVESPTVSVGGTNIALPYLLRGVPVTSGGNYTDADGQQWICDEVDFERGVYVQWFKTLVLTGEEEWVENPSYPGRFSTSLNGGIANGGLCSHYPVTSSHEDASMYATYTARIMINDSRFIGNLAGFKSWLVNQNAMGTPVVGVFRLHADGDGGKEIVLSESELAAYRALHSNYPNTTVLNDARAHMSVAYVADTKTYIDNRIKEALS